MHGYRAAGGRFTNKKRDAVSFVPLVLACGYCQGCRLEKSRQWAVRITHESRLHERNSFLTLTYTDEDLPLGRSLDTSHPQLFMKRLRKRLPNKVRFFLCGEYGDLTQRPHYHLALFGHDFHQDRKIHSRTPHGDDLYTSALLEEVWGMGHCPIGDLTFESAAYIARYVMKKAYGAGQEFIDRYVDQSTGLVREPEFVRMSLKPGIGRGFLDKYMSDVYPSDEVIINGKTARPPRYYDKIMEEKNPQQFKEIKLKRQLKAKLTSITENQLNAKAEILTKRLSLRFEREPAK